MSKNWGRTPITNADKRGLTQTSYFVSTDEGPEERIDRRPQGKVERFVDKDGNVISATLYADGDPNKHQTEIRTRATYHAKGFVEHAKCPIKNGTRYSSDITRKDFAKMPTDLQGECLSDPKVMERKDGDLWARTGCKHIEWLVAFRTDQAAKAYAKRNAHVAAAEKARQDEENLKLLQAELLKEQIAERKRKPKAKDATE